MILVFEGLTNFINYNYLFLLQLLLLLINLVSRKSFNTKNFKSIQKIFRTKSDFLYYLNYKISTTISGFLYNVNFYNIKVYKCTQAVEALRN